MDSGPAVRWLLTEGGPSIRYRTLTELLGRPDDPAVAEARAAIPASPEVVRILRGMHPDGYWLRKNGAGRPVGDGVEYTGTATTHFCLSYLAELGMDRDDPRVARAAERYLGLQQPDGDFWLHLSCLLGYNVRTFVRLGYRDDPRVQRSVALLLDTERADGGYLCDLHEGKRVRRPEKSCVRGSGKALAAFAEFPDRWSTPRCQELVEYFLTRGGVFRSRAPGRSVVPEAVRTRYPFTWGIGLVEVLLALATMGYGRRPELDRAWALLEAKRDPEGGYRLDQATAPAAFSTGRVGEPNQWITFYALLARHRRESSPAS